MSAHLCAWCHPGQEGNHGICERHKRELLEEAQALKRAQPAPDVEAEAREKLIREMADDQRREDGECEIDDDARISEGEGNGAYVQAWVWVSFDGTPLDKEAEV